MEGKKEKEKEERKEREGRMALSLKGRTRVSGLINWKSGAVPLTKMRKAAGKTDWKKRLLVVRF